MHSCRSAALPPSSQFGRLCLHVGLLLTEMDGAPRAIGGRFNQPGILQARRLKSQRSQIIVHIQRMAPLYSIGLNGRFRLQACGRLSQGIPFDKAMVCLSASEPTREMFTRRRERRCIGVYEPVHKLPRQGALCTVSWRLSLDLEDNCTQMVACGRWYLRPWLLALYSPQSVLGIKT